MSSIWIVGTMISVATMLSGWLIGFAMGRRAPGPDERFEFLKKHCSSCIFLGNEDTDRGAWADKIVRDGNYLWIALGRERERTELVRDARRVARGLT